MRRPPVLPDSISARHAENRRRFDGWARREVLGLDGTISALSCYVPRMDGLPVGESDCVADDPPCDFVVHIAQRLGVDRDAARATLREWLLQYDLKTASPPPIRLASGTQPPSPSSTRARHSCCGGRGVSFDSAAQAWCFGHWPRAKERRAEGSSAAALHCRYRATHAHLGFPRAGAARCDR